MATKGLGQDTELAVKSVIEGLGYDIDVNDISEEKIKPAMEAKMASFNAAKQLINRWRKSQNAPNEKKLISIIKTLIEAGELAQENLRNALKKQIDYKDLDPSKHRGAVMAKPIILNAIYDFEGGIFELRQQLEAGVINTQDDEFKIGFPEKFANGEMLDVSKRFQNWYNAKEDAVKICPFGTEGKIINLEGLKVQLPKQPKNKEDILFHDLPKEEQYWRRLPVPDGITKETIGDYTEYIHEEFRRRVDGIWFYNNGVPTYLTPHHYFALQWGRMFDNGEYGYYREPQARMFYHTQAVMIDSRCVGKIFEKGRRTGFTQEIMFTMLNKITMTKNYRVGMTSKTEDDVIMLFKKLSYSFQNLPFYFRPVVKGKIDSETILHFAKPSDGTKEGKKKEDTGTEKYLNSMIDWRKPTQDAYDSEQLDFYLGDEFAKRKAGKDMEVHFQAIKPTMIQGGRVVGKMFLGSTIGSKNESVDAFKSIADTSEVKDRNKITKMTPSGLYRYTLYAHENYESYIDRYGICHTKKPRKETYNQFGGLIAEGSLDFIMASANDLRKKSDKQFNEFMKANPVTREDMYRSDSSVCQFNLAKLQEQMIQNSRFDIEPIFRGNFYRDSAGVVQFRRDDQHGKFYVFWLPPKELRNKYVIRGSRKYPANNWLGAGGVDSYDIDETVDERSSNGALHLFTRTNTDGHPSNKFVLEYIERPPYANIFYEDVMMAAEFYGFPLLIENNKYGIVRYFEKKNMIGYVLKRPKEYTPEGSKGTKQYGMPSNSIDIIQTQAQAVEEYVHYNVGMWTEQDEEFEQENGRTGNRKVGEMGDMYFDRTLKDWSGFDIKKRTKYDATISSSLAILACKIKANKRDGTPEKGLKGKPFIKGYKTGGINSKFVKS